MTTEFIELFSKAISESLKDREKLIIELRFGLIDGETQTLQEIGSQIGVTRERIRQLINKSIKKIISKASSSIKHKRLNCPCLALLKYIQDRIMPDDDDVVNRLLEFTNEELLYLPQSSLAVPLIAHLVYRSKKKAGYAVLEARSIIKERNRILKIKLSEYNNKKRCFEKFNNLISYTIWPDQMKLVHKENFPKMGKQRDVSFENNEFSGFFHSFKLTRIVQYESGLEHDFLINLEKEDSVLFYQEQPFSIPYLFNGKQRTYIPDIFFVLNDGRAIVVEIKPKFLMALHINLEKFSALKKFCIENGFGLLITDGKYCIQDVMNYDINPDFKNKILNTLKSRPLNWNEYKFIRDSYKAKPEDFLSLVLKYKLAWELSPFNLSFRINMDL